MTKNFLYNLLLSLVNILFPILTFPYASHILGPSGIGKVQFVVSFAQYFALFAALGIPIYGIKETARFRDDPEKLSAVFTELTVISFGAGLIMFLIYLGVVFMIPFFEAGRTLYLYAGALGFLSFTYTDWFYSGIEAFKTITLRSILIKIIALVFLYVFVRTEADFGKYLLIILFSILGNQLLGFSAAFSKTRFNFTTAGYRKHLKPIFYIFGASVASSIYTVLDTVLLGFLSTNEAVGFYTAAVKLVKISIPFVTSMGVILMPAISNSFATNNLQEVKKLLNNSFDFLVFFTFPASAGLIMLAPELIFVFSGQKFAPASSCMQILSLLPLLIGFGHLFSFQVLIPSGKNKETFLSMSAGLISCLVLNFSLVPFLHEKGAAVAMVITELIVTLSYFYFASKHYAFQFNKKLAWQSFVSILPFVPIVLFLRQTLMSSVTILLAAIFLCTTVYVCTHLFLFKNSFLFTFINPIKSRLRLKTDVNE